MKKIALVLEDDENRIEEFKKRFNERSIIDVDFSDNYNDCISKLSINEYQLINMDHDLGHQVFVDSSEENTGAGVARWILKNKDKILGNPTFVVHSLNPVGSENIENIIKEAGFPVYRVPFVWTKNNFEKIGV